MKNTRFCALAAAAALALLLTGCPPRRGDGFKPPPTSEPMQAWRDNWSALELTSGAWNVAFRYDDGQVVRLVANMVVESAQRCRIDLSSSRGAEAIVIVRPDVINLVNHSDRYHVREQFTPENADRMIGLYLAPAEVTAVLDGRGFDPERFEHLGAEPDGSGGRSVRAFHGSEDMRVEAYVDTYGRLRWVRFFDAIDERPLVHARYYNFTRDRSTGVVWPAWVEIDLLMHGEQVTLRAADVDINASGLDLDYVFTPRQRGGRLFLEDLPPGPPLLYRSAKEYVREDQ